MSTVAIVTWFMEATRTQRQRGVGTRRRPVRRTRATRSVEILDNSAETGPNDVEIVQVQGSTCIDLTEDDGDSIVELTPRPVVDLTSVNDSPIVVLGSQSDSPPSRRRRRQRHQVSISSDSDSDIDEFPTFERTGTPYQRPAGAEPGTSGLPQALSPDGKGITCPVCLDSDKQIRASGRQIFSTNCGHVFCNECIRGSIQSQKKCPTCRKKLTMKSIHPLFI